MASMNFNSLKVAVATFASRVAGVVRDVILANIFGAGGEMDSFLYAFRIPNFFRRIFAEGAFSQAFLPLLIKVKEESDEVDLKKFIASVHIRLLSAVGIITVLFIAFSPFFARVFAPGYVDTPEKLNLVADLLKITAPYLFFISLTAFTSSLLHAKGVFFIPSVTPILLNIALILAAVLSQNIHGLALGVLVAGLCQLLFVTISMWRHYGWVPSFSLKQHPAANNLLVIMLPGILTASVMQINVLVDSFVASFLVDGSVAWLYFSNRIADLPLGVFAIAISTVILPRLVQLNIGKKKSEGFQVLDKGIALILVTGIPSCVGLIVISGPIISFLFGNGGEFSEFDVVQTAKSLSAYSIGIPAIMVAKLQNQYFFSIGDTKTPMKISMISIILNAFTTVTFAFLWSHIGIAVATAISAWVQCGLLAFHLNIKHDYKVTKLLLGSIIRFVLGALAMGVVVYSLRSNFWYISDLDFMSKAVRVAFFVVAGGLTYVISLVVLGIKKKDIFF